MRCASRTAKEAFRPRSSGSARERSREQGTILVIAKMVAFTAHLFQSRAQESPSSQLAMEPFCFFGAIDASTTAIEVASERAGLPNRPFSRRLHSRFGHKAFSWLQAHWIVRCFDDHSKWAVTITLRPRRIESDCLR